MKRRATAIAPSSRFILLAEATRGRSGLAFSRLAALPLDGPLRRASEPEARQAQIGEALREGLKRLKLKPDDVLLAIRQAETKTRFARLPASTPDEIEQMARFEIEKAIPFDRERHVSDAVALRTLGLEGADTLMEAVDSPVLDAALKGLDRAGIFAETTTAAGWGLYCLWRRAAQQASATKPAPKKEDASSAEKSASPKPVASLESDGSPGPDSGRRLVAYLGLGGVDVILIQNGLPVYTFHSSAGGLEKLLRKLREGGTLQAKHATGLEVDLANFATLMPSAEEEAKAAASAPAVDPTATSSNLWAIIPGDEAVFSWATRLLQEIKRGIQFAMDQGDFGPLDEIFILGPGAVVKGLDLYLGNNLGAPASRLDPLGGMAPPARPATQKPFEGREGLAVRAGWPEAELELFGEIAGVALNALEPEFGDFDLTPEWYRAQRERGVKRRSQLVTAVIAAAALGTVGYYLNLNHQYQQNYMDQIRAENENLAPYAKIVSEKRDKLGIVKKHVEDKYTVLAVLDMLNQLAVIKDRRARLTQLEFERGEEVVLRGHAKSLADINEFQDALEDRRDFFAEVQNRDNTPRALSGGRNFYSFDLVCRLRSIASSRSGSRGESGGRASRTVAVSAGMARPDS
jgi:Tfp pilus assembly PilM family ATPase